ncbi:MAG: YfhO family protein, partial [Candidatus Choladocola sp.]|nr:YfhO family protein [Candidatus Choladocola sp.]
GEVKEYTSPGEAKESVEDTPLAAVDELNDDSFYRVATARHAYDTSSAGMLLDYNGITMIYSTFNGCISEFLEKMGCTTYSATQLLGLNNRTFLSALASVKYYSCYDDHTRPLPYGYEDILHTTVNGRETTVSENQFALPLGYTYTNAISEEELEEYSVLERQEVMMQEVVLNDDPDGLAGESSAEITRQKLDILSVDQNGVFLTDHALTAKKTDEDSKYYEITLHFDGQADTETYLVLNHAFLEGDMTENAITLEMKLEDNSLSYRFAADDDRYGSGQEDYVFNLGYHEEPVTSCTIRMSRQGQIQFDSLELYAQPMDNMQQYTDALTEDVLENVEMDTNRVSGTVSLEQDKILVLSIPYQNGWTAYVDGKETKLQRANYMYMALPLSEGDHTIELTFEIPGMKYALVIMAGAVVLFIILCMMRWIRNRKKRKVNSQER